MSRQHGLPGSPRRVGHSWVKPGTWSAITFFLQLLFGVAGRERLSASLREAQVMAPRDWALPNLLGIALEEAISSTTQ